MALAIDASTPAVATQTNGTIATVATASFTPPANSTLLVMWTCDATSAPSAPSITDNLGVPLTYTRTDWVSVADSPNAGGQAAAWTAPVATSAAMTVTVTSGSASGDRVASLKVIVLTGADPTTPVGVHGKSGSKSASSIAQNYTAAATSGWGFIAVSDFDGLGAETAGTGCTLIDSATVAAAISYGYIRRTSADDSSGSSNTLNVTIPGTSTNLSWVYVEIVPPSSGSLAGPPAQVVPQQRMRTRPPMRPLTLTPGFLPAQVIPLPPIAVARHVKQPPEFFPIALNPPFLPAQVRPVAPIVVAPQFRPPPGQTAAASAAQILVAAAGILPLTVTVVAQQFRPPSVLPVVITPPPLPQAPAPIVVVPSRPQPTLTATIALAPTIPQAPPLSTPAVVVTSTWRPNQPQISLSLPAFLPAPVPVLALPPILVAPAFRVEPQWPPAVLTPSLLVAALCVTSPPNTGTTARPDTGTTVYALASTARPDTGVTVPPNTGATQDPC